MQLGYNGRPVSPASVITVVAALIVREGRLLICQRRHNDVFPLQWEFPGGKVHAGETPKEALARELQEELGISAAIGKEIHRTRHRYPEMAFGIELIFLRASLPADAKPQNLVFAKMEWAKPEQLPDYDFLPADREFVGLLAHGAVCL